MSKPVIIAVTSDHHTNSTLGLSPASVTLDDGGSYRPSRLQNKLRRHWVAFVEQSQRMKEVYGGSLISVFNGDVTDGDHHQTRQIISANRSEIVRVAVRTLAPLVEISDRSYFIRGTSAHAGNSAELEEQIARELGGEEMDGSHSVYSLLLDVQGVTIDFAHHTTMGRVKWTARNAANKIAADAIFQAGEHSLAPPNLVIRSHNHRWSDSYDNYASCRAICTPSWQFKTEFVYRIDASAVAEIGGLWIIVEDGQYDIMKYKMPIIKPTPVKIKV